MIPNSYGVVIDVHYPRQDKGIPSYFDGWYDTRLAAENALEYIASQLPGAYVHLVARLATVDEDIRTLRPPANPRNREKTL
jgi:hypothetical protein